MARKIKSGELRRQGTADWGSGAIDVAGVNSAGEIAGQILAPAMAAANNP